MASDQVFRSSAAALALLSAFAARPAPAQTRQFAPSVTLRAMTHLPLGVPAGYVLTRGGFFHPSCVLTVHADETVGADRVIRGPAGSERRRVSACAYPRFSAAGALRVARALPSAKETPLLAPPHAHAPSSYDGWILSWDYSGALKNAGQTVTVSTDVIIPPEPTKTGNDQDVAFFNSVETNLGTTDDILQPVITFGGFGSYWALESEHCCVDDNDMHSDPIKAHAGDLIRGTVTGTDCDQKGVCQAWNVKTADITSGQTGVLNTGAPVGAIEEINPAVLETYGVSSCDMLPPNGEITYFNHSVKSADGQALSLTYALTKAKPMTAEFPTDCGFRGEQAGDAYTLIWSKNPTSSGGAANAGGAAGIGGQGGAAGNATGGTSGGVGGAAESSAGASGSVTAAGNAGAGAGGEGTSSAGSSGASGAGGAEHDAQGGMLGFAGSAAGSVASAGALSAAPSASDAETGSCSCRAGARAARPNGASYLALLGVVGLVSARRRRTRSARLP